MEPIREVRAPWKYLKRDINIKWEHGIQDQYTGLSGVPLTGPSKNIVRIAGTAKSLSCLFMSIIHLSFFQQVENLTNKYSYKDWVVEKTAKDWDGNFKTNNYLFP